MNPVIALAIPFFVLTIVVEWRLLKNHDEHVGYHLKDSATSISMGIGYLALATLYKVAFVAAYVLAYEYRVVDIGSFWWMWPIAVVAQDFCFYWFHRAGHEIRVMWAGHVNHHSSDHYNYSTALRQSWTEHLFGPIFWAPLALIGVPVEVLIAIESFNLLYQYWLHTELIGSMGRFGLVFNTPSFHRVHHGRNLEYLDKNYAGTFIIWDRMFGTFEPEVAPVEYGIVKPLESHNLFVVAFHEWSSLVKDVWAARTLRGKLGHILRPPGWREDGEHQTVKAMLNHAAADHAPAE
ncbi:MAG: sterol desaturase/sphingolipid hydroxylase (fatty acid hydroxylase superfamily) [Bradymonadia bacterium]|jgi:sterol desaturase/sphingolipid hydroxylase (fatty acid hydroxylase superfamily)